MTENKPAENGQPSSDPLHRYIHRHPGTQHAMRMLLPNPNLTGDQAVLARWIWDAGSSATETLGDGPELVAGLRKLLEAKDCLVRQSLVDDGRI